jgi:hypothetical protein
MRRSSVLTIGVLSLALTLTACGDSRLKDLTIGMARDSVDLVMETSTPHREESYFMNGQLWQVLLYTRSAPAQDSVEWREMSPVVLADGSVAGWGWDWWETKAGELNVTLPPK